MNKKETRKNFQFREEAGLFVGLFTLLCFFLFGKSWLTDLTGWFIPLCLFSWLFFSMLWLSFRVVYHADCLAVKLGEPYGTLILTLAVISIEVVMITAIMLASENNPSLGRDMMFAVLMIVLNGLVGISLICGGLKHLEQVHNLQGANTFLVVLLPLAALTLILPNYTQSSSYGTYSTLQMIFAVIVSGALYAAFLTIQTMRHQGFFMIPGGSPEDDHDHGNLIIRPAGYHAFLLLLSMVPIVLLSKSMAKLIDYKIDVFSAPAALGGVLIAILVLAPEGMAAINSALTNRLQRSINICLGSGLATIGMTVPAILLIGLFTGKSVVLGLDPVDSILLVTTLVVSMVTFSSTKTNVIHGIVHMTLFIAYLVMVFD